MKVCFITFGCRLNRAEALQEEANYLAKGWELTEKHSEADLFVVRGCSVTSRAQRDCEKTIDHLHRKYPFKRLVICGCLPKEKLSTAVRIPGKANLAKDSASPVPTRTARAYLKVQDGCSGKCSFCIVPQFRGKSVSEPFDDLLGKARSFIDSGYREIVVTGCNLTLYASGGKRLPELVAALAELSSECRIRLGSVEPGDCAAEIVDVIAEHANVCRYLHLPVQSGSNTVLAAMRRPYSVRDIERIAEKARIRLPDLGLGCDLISGFPGETDMDHVATKGLVERIAFNHGHIFPYSKRPGTPSAASLSVVPKEIRSHRAHELARLVDAQRSHFAKRFVGREVEVVIEDESKQAGWTSEYIWFESLAEKPSTDFPRKSLARFVVKKATPHRLLG